MTETRCQRTAGYLKKDPLLGDVRGWSSTAPQEWEAAWPGLAIRQLRWRLGLTQRSLAARAGLRQGNVQRVEAGIDCRLSTLTRLLAAMGFEPMLALRPRR